MASGANHWNNRMIGAVVGVRPFRGEDAAPPAPTPLPPRTAANLFGVG
jgi:delta 1-pyrroline-5-carboxylate dehydrogenase